MLETKKQRYKIEALKRMKALTIFEDTISQFEQSDLISYSLNGGNYWLDDSLKKNRI